MIRYIIIQYQGLRIVQRNWIQIVNNGNPFRILSRRQICPSSLPAHFNIYSILTLELGTTEKYFTADPLANFLYALKASETRRQYPRRLNI